jgi:ApeA N-terminal domain 1
VKSFTYSGEWWLPSREEYKVAGEATFAGDDQTKLAVQGLLGDAVELEKKDFLAGYPVILGRTATGQPMV